LLREIERDVERTFGTLAWFGAEVLGHEEAGESNAVWYRLELLHETDRQEARELAAREEAGGKVGAGQANDDESQAGATESQADGSNTPSSTPSTARRRPRTRRDALLRPLFLYAFLNPGVSFVQGMSYLAAIFYYAFAPALASEDPTRPLAPLETEATTFFALGALLSQLRDVYLPTLDNLSSPPLSALPPSATGLGATVARFNALLLAIDPPVADALDRKRVDMSGLVMRWLTTMFATAVRQYSPRILVIGLTLTRPQFPLPDVLRIWECVSFLPSRQLPVG
jgi:hypothetical protein